MIHYSNRWKQGKTEDIKQNKKKINTNLLPNQHNVTRKKVMSTKTKTRINDLVVPRHMEVKLWNI